MNQAEIRNSFSAMRQNISATDECIREMIPLLANRLQACSAGKYSCSDALTSMKRELRNWDITRKKWKEPK